VLGRAADADRNGPTVHPRRGQGRALTQGRQERVQGGQARPAFTSILGNRASFMKRALIENYAAAIDDVFRLKPAAAMGRYRGRSPLHTMGPVFPVDPSDHGSHLDLRKPPRAEAPFRLVTLGRG